MSKILNFSKRNLKEILRDPIIYIFCLIFPLIMLILFQIINKYTGGNTPMFELSSLLPAIIMFSYTFVMLTMALIVSKDTQTFFLKRLYTSPMKSYHYLLGYFSVGFLIGIFQAIICVIAGLIISLITGVSFLSFLEIVLLIISQLPILIMYIFLGILLGILFNDKTAPGICSIFISLAGVLGGCWMPLEAMGKFETFCRFLPFYPSVYIGRIITKATNSLGSIYTFDNTARLGLVTVFLFAIGSIGISIIAFKRNMVSDKT